MRTTIITSFVVFFLSFQISNSQSLKPGKYQSDDGNINVSVSILEDGSIELIDPRITSVYIKSGDLFRNSNPKYTNYLIRVESENIFYTLKDNNDSEFRFTWIGNETMVSEDCVLYEKYLDLAGDENEVEVQAYTFCAAAALAKCNYTEEGYKTYAAGVVTLLKQIIVDSNVCPCLDVIPISIWNSN